MSGDTGAGLALQSEGALQARREAQRLKPPSPHLVLQGPGSENGFSGLGCAGSQRWHTGSFSYGMQDLIPNLGSNPGPLHWECGVLDTGQPGKS